MKIKFYHFVFIAGLFLFTFSGCEKEGLGGESMVSGNVSHHSTAIPNALVYVKIDATESAGTDVNNYDHSVAADGNGDYSISSLKKGNYFLFATGWDSSVSQTVIGGVPIRIDEKDANLTINVPVTED